MEKEFSLSSKIYKYREIKVCVLSIAGELDFTTQFEVEKYIQRIKEKMLFNLIVDFNKVDLISSSGWGVFIGNLNDFHHNQGDIRFTGLNSYLIDIFYLLELDTFFYHFDDLDETIKSFIKSQGKKVVNHNQKKQIVSSNRNKKAPQISYSKTTQLKNIELENIKIKEEKILLLKTIDELKKQNYELKNRLFIFTSSRNKIDEKELQQAIKEIIIKNPEYGSRRIKKSLWILKSIAVSQSTIYRRLCQLNLNTRRKRMLYSRKKY